MIRLFQFNQIWSNFQRHGFSSTIKPRVLSGIQPTGELHLGNYLGAIRNWVNDEENYENYYCVVDLHAITSPFQAHKLHSNTLDLISWYLACGLNYERSTLFVQSHVPYHTQLSWLLTSIIPLNWLQRMTQFKSKV